MKRQDSMGKYYLCFKGRKSRTSDFFSPYMYTTPKTKISLASACRFICFVQRQKGIGSFILLSSSSDLAQNTSMNSFLEQYFSSICLTCQRETQRYCLARIVAEQFSRLDNTH